MENSHLILAELQSLRTDFNDYARATGERLASLETSMKSLVGNGQPGRITELETKVSRVQRWQWRATGIGVGIISLIELALRVFKA